jgi:hypothetical protein
LSVCEISGGIVTRSACGSTTSRMLATKLKPSARAASNCWPGIVIGAGQQKVDIEERGHVSAERR